MRLKYVHKKPNTGVPKRRNDAIHNAWCSSWLPPRHENLILRIPSPTFSLVDPGGGEKQKRC